MQKKNRDLRNDYSMLKDFLLIEDRVISDRIQIFLVINSLLLLSYKLGEVSGGVISILGMVLSLMWAYVANRSLESHHFLGDLMVEIEVKWFGKRGAIRKGIISRKRAESPKLMGHVDISSTWVLSRLLPAIFTILWAVLFLTR